MSFRQVPDGFGRLGRIAPDEASRKARKVLGQVASGEGPASERTATRRMSTLGEVFEEDLEDYKEYLG